MNGRRMLAIVISAFICLSFAEAVSSEEDGGKRKITLPEYLSMVVEGDPGLKELASYLQASRIKLSFTRKGEGYRTSLVLSSGKDLRESSIALRQNLPFGGNLDIYGRFSQSDLERNYIGDAAWDEVSYGVAFEIPFFAENLQKLSEMAAELDYEIASLQYEIARRELTASAVNAFYDFLLAKEKVKIHRRAVELAEVLTDMSRGEFERGISVDIGLLESEVQLASAKADLSRSLLELENAKARLRQLMNLGEDVDFSVEADLGSFIPPPEGLEVSEILKESPYIKLLDLGVDKLKLSARELRSDFEFRAILSAECERTAGGRSFPPDLGKFRGEPELNVKLEIPIWDSHVTAERAGEVMSRVEGLSYAREKERRELRLRIERELRKWKFNAEIIDMLSESERSALKNLSFMESKFRAGLAGVEDVIRAQTNLTRASLERVRSIIEQRKSEAELYRLTGIGSFMHGLETER